MIETVNQLTDLTSCGVEFLPPEAVSLQSLTTGADIWSAGVLACHMMTGHSPFLRETNEATILAITSSSSLDLTSKNFTNLSPECLDFIAVATLARNSRKKRQLSNASVTSGCQGVVGTVIGLLWTTPPVPPAGVSPWDHHPLGEEEWLRGVQWW